MRLALLLLISISIVCCYQERIEQFFGKNKGSHTNNWVVIISTSKSWYNYRHSANALSIYRTVKRLGIDDERIILLLAEDTSCDSRNPFPGTVFNNRNHKINLYGDDIEVDYRGYEVTVENFIRILTGRHDPDVPRSKRLMSDSESNILIYMTGHGGDDFLKFQEIEEISSKDIADAIEQMRIKKRYNEILLMIDTCQAATLLENIYSPNVISIGSSVKGESSYSHHSDAEIGVTVIDRFTFHTLEFFESSDIHNRNSLLDLFRTYTFKKLLSHAQWYKHDYKKDISRVPVTDFFGSIKPVSVTEDKYPV